MFWCKLAAAKHHTATAHSSCQRRDGERENWIKLKLCWDRQKRTEKEDKIIIKTVIKIIAHIQNKWFNCSPPTEWCPDCPQETSALPSSPWSTLPKFYVSIWHHRIWNIPLTMWVSCPGSFPSISCAPSVSSLAGQHKKQKNLQLHQQQLKYQCVINIILIISPKRSTITATLTKTNATPTRTRTVYQNASSENEVTRLIIYSKQGLIGHNDAPQNVS